MKAITKLLILLVALPTGVMAQDMEPVEPEIVLPEVVLQIQDLSVETVSSGLPDEDTLLPTLAERPLPELPPWQELEVALPDPGVLGATGEDLWSPGRGVSAQVVLGAGTLSHIYGGVDLTSTGDTPRFGLSFVHDMADGFGDNGPGEGFDLREDTLEGELRLTPGKLVLDGQGAYRELDRGLQGQSPYASRTTRSVDLSTSLTLPLADRLSLTGQTTGAYRTELFSGAGSLRNEEAVLSPGVGISFDAERFHAGLDTDYRYSRRDEDAHRAEVAAEIVYSPGEALRIGGRGGWYWATDIGHLFPFRVHLETAVAPLTFEMAGGYRVVEQDWGSYWSDYALSVASEDLVDNHGWFVSSALGVALAQTLSLQGEAVYGWDRALLQEDQMNRYDPVTGLFVGRQEAVDRLTISAGLRWTIGRVLSLGTSASAELLEVPLLSSRYTLQANAGISEVGGAYGAAADLGWELDRSGPQGSAETVPFLNISGFYRISERIRLILETEDLLSPVLDGPRVLAAPFEEPGINGILKIEIDL